MKTLFYIMSACIVAVYLIISYGLLEFNPANWSETDRIGHVIMSILFAFLAWLVINANKRKS